MNPRKAELHNAYVWDCDECGKENFLRAVIVEFSPEDEAEMKALHGVDEFQTGRWETSPDDVTCKHCGTVFDVALPDDEEMEDE